LVWVVVCPSVCDGCIVAKRCDIGSRLLLITNRKSHWLSNDMKIVDLGLPWRVITHYGMPTVRYCGQMISLRGSAMVPSNMALTTSYWLSIVIIMSPSAAVWPYFLMKVSSSNWPYLTDRTPHIGFQITWQLLTLNGLEGYWQPVRSANLAIAWFLVLSGVIITGLTVKDCRKHAVVMQHLSRLSCYWLIS